ncbi:MAG: hypothetical protein IKD01_05365 [Oscillospiraceae bacterium]|nr:hypothetical protein [Oscillospiraceae bacterium]
MDYTPENIDIPAFEEALKQSREYHRAELYRKFGVACAFYDGYAQCVDDVITMLHCSNEKRQQNETQ